MPAHAGDAVVVPLPSVRPRSLLRRLLLLRRELTAFVVVGGFCFLLDLGMANVLYLGLGLGPTTSKVLATMFATLVSYVGNRLWSFAHRVSTDSGQVRDLSVFAAVNAAGLVITLIPVDVAHYVLSLTSPLAFNVSAILGTAVATVFRFWAYRRWVFRGTRPAEPALLPAA